MRRFLLLFAAVFLSLAAVAEELTKIQCLFGSAAEKCEAVSAYNETWNTTSGGYTWSVYGCNNNRNQWGYMRTGASATITSTAAIKEKIIKVGIDIKTISTANIQSIKLEIASDVNFSNVIETLNFTYNVVGEHLVDITAPASDMYYKISITCGTAKKLEINSINFYYSSAALLFDQESVELTYGDVFAAPTLKNADGKTINWESSNTDVATVDGTGYVEIKGIGTTKITATDATDNTNTASYTITVKDPNAIEHVLTTSEFPGNNAYKTVRKYTAPHGIVYVAQFFESNGIQLNSKPESPGIVVTANPDGYILSKVIVEWNANCTAGRSLEIYGSNEAYTATSELKATATNTTPEKGTKIGSLTSAKGTETELDVTGAYRFIGIRALEAVNIDKITLVWVVPAPEFKADITIAVDETKGGANVVSFSNLAVSNGVEFDFTDYNVYLNGTEIGSAANGETLSYLPFLPSAAFTISNGTNTYPVVVNWPITDFSTIKAKVAGVEYWAWKDAEHKIDTDMWYLDAVYTIEPDCAVPNLYFEMTCTIFDEKSVGKIVKVDGNKVEVGNVGFFVIDNDVYKFTTHEDGAFIATLSFPFYVQTALKGMMLPAYTEKVISFVGVETLIDVTDSAVVPQPGDEGGKISGVESVVVDSEGAVEYYNLQGVRVEGALTPGIYIRRTATGTSKVAIR